MFSFCFYIVLSFHLFCHTLGSEATRSLVDSLKDFVDDLFWSSGIVAMIVIKTTHNTVHLKLRLLFYGFTHSLLSQLGIGLSLLCHLS